MWIIADTHVHLYWGYDLGLLFRTALAALTSRAREIVGNELSEDWRGVLCLVERAGQHFFADLQEGNVRIPGFEIHVLDDPLALQISDSAGGCLHLVAGRQIVTREGVEVLALGVAKPVPDGISIVDVIKAVREQAGLPVVAWALGKWMFQRGQVVSRLLEQGRPDEFAIGDSSLRPRNWLTPHLLRLAEQRGFVLLAGSDPLISPSEVAHVGRYVTAVKASWSEREPTQSVLDALRAVSLPHRCLGLRSSFGEVLWRVAKHWILQKKYGGRR